MKKIISGIIAGAVLCSIVTMNFEFGNNMTINAESKEQLVYTYNGHSYYIYDGVASTWDEAKMYCENMGGHLATITTGEEQAFIEGLVEEFIKDDHECYALYIGGYRTAKDDKWHWVDGSEFEYTHWDALQPDNKKNEESKLEIWAKTGEFTEDGEYWIENFGYWNDGSGARKEFFICEWDYPDVYIESDYLIDGLKEFYNGNTYQILCVKDGFDWDAEKKYCESLGGHLLTINSKDEQAFVENLINNYLEINPFCLELHIGAYYSEKDSKWYWVDDSEFKYTHWDVGQPDNYENIEDKMSIYAVSQKYETWAQNFGCWNDQSGKEASYFICEWDSASITKPEVVEKDPKIENVQMYLELYKEALDNYIKAAQNASKNDYNEVKKNSSDKEGYLKLMEYDSSKTSSNRLITFGFLGNSKEEKNAREDTYEVLYEFLIKSIDAANQKNIINFDIDNSKTLPEIEANMINKIYDSVKKTCKNPDQGTGSHGYTVDLDVYGGIFGFGFGKVTITKEDKKYDAIYCSDSNLVAKAMNQYIDDLCNEVKKQYKDASFALWKYFLDTSTINSIRTDIMKQKLEDYTDTLIEMGYGKLLENIVIAKDTYETFSEVLKYSRKIDYNTLKSLLSENDKEKSKLFFKAIKNGKLSDKEVKNKLVSDAMNKLEKARQNAESALYDYIYDANTLKGESKSWIKSIFSCPVNVDVIDDVTQEVVGYVHDGEVYSDGSIEVEYSYEMKSVTLPKDKKYRFVLTGTDDGNMQIIYKDIIDGYEESYIAFYDVPLREGIVYTQDITTTNLQDDISLFPELIADDSTTISASAYYKSQDEDRYISITSNTSSGGICYGGGEYTKGDSVLLSAVPSEGYQFDGWYEDDILVCCNDVFRFPAMYSRNINAKFEKIYSEADDFNWNINEAYIGDLTFWNYINKENLNVEFSIYTEHSNLEAVLCYSNDVENKIQLTTEDGIHYLIENIVVDELKLIVITDSEGNEIASLELIESGNTSDVATTTAATTSTTITTTTTAITTTKFEQIEYNYIYGDVNLDYMVNKDDEKMLTSYLLNEIVISPAGLFNADVNNDDEISDTDLIILNMFINRQISVLPYTGELPEVIITTNITTSSTYTTTTTSAITVATSTTTTTTTSTISNNTTGTITTTLITNPSMTTEITQAQVFGELINKANKILKETGTTPIDIYNFVSKNNTYRYIEETRSLDQIESKGWDYFANYAINNRYVVQYYFAAITELLFQCAGYESRIVYGTGRGTGDHYWNQILIGEEWINYDACNGYYEVDDDYLRKQNYTFKEYLYPRFLPTIELEYLLGDVNNDGSVDSSDASLVLAEYAKIQTGGVGEFTETQHKAADVNNDGVVDSSDASKILAYYAMISTGKEPIWD